MFKLTPYVLHNLTSKKATRRYPQEKRSAFENSRGKLVNQIELCIFCSSCMIKCPSQCIRVDKKTAVWTYDPFACVYCGICVGICPGQSLLQRREYRPPSENFTVISMQGEPPKKSKKSKTE
jgi:ech hydrogenase subunit F